MKRIILLMLCLVLILSSLALFACKDKKDGSSDDSSDSGSSDGPTMGDIIYNDDGSITLPDDEFE